MRSVVRNCAFLVKSCLFFLLFSDTSVDITGVTASELSVNNVDYQVLNDSVITIPDADKYQDQVSPSTLTLQTAKVTVQK